MKPVVLLLLSVLAVSACAPTEKKLVTSSEIKGDSIPKPLVATSPNSEMGKRVFVNRNAGHCVLCHAVQGLDAEFQGNVGPDLTDVGNRLTEGQIRLRIVDYQLYKSGALMPSYYRIHNLSQVASEYQNQPALNAEEIEHLIAFLSSLKDPSP